MASPKAIDSTISGPMSHCLLRRAILESHTVITVVRASRASGDAHSSQNFAPERFSCCHRGHFIGNLPTAEPLKGRSSEGRLDRSPRSGQPALHDAFLEVR